MKHRVPCENAIGQGLLPAGIDQSNPMRDQSGPLLGYNVVMTIEQVQNFIFYF